MVIGIFGAHVEGLDAGRPVNDEGGRSGLFDEEEFVLDAQVVTVARPVSFPLIIITFQDHIEACTVTKNSERADWLLANQ